MKSIFTFSKSMNGLICGHITQQKMLGLGSKSFSFIRKRKQKLLNREEKSYSKYILQTRFQRNLKLFAPEVLSPKIVWCFSTRATKFWRSRSYLFFAINIALSLISFIAEQYQNFSPSTCLRGDQYCIIIKILLWTAIKNGYVYIIVYSTYFFFNILQNTKIW